MDNGEWREFLEMLRKRWKSLWEDRIDDRVRAEGISNEDYDMLFVDQGTVIVATRNYEPPDFRDILDRHLKDKKPGKIKKIKQSIEGMIKTRAVEKRYSRSKKLSPRKGLH